ncbi:MAG: oxidoreductase [Acidimicrobiia bacterium]
MTTLGVTTTADEAIGTVDLTGKVAIITGSSGGIGLETARTLARAGATVVLANRDAGKCAAAAAHLRASLPPERIELGDLDLASLASVRRFATSVAEAHPQVDLLINNAGVMAAPLSRTADGFELQLGTNHLGHFLLTNLLLPNVLAAPGSRIVNLSSSAHRRGGVNWDDPNYRTSDYEPWLAYAQSKTANILFTLELERRLEQSGTHAFAVHPGVIDTDLGRHLDDEQNAWKDAQIKAGGIFMKSTQQGAATTVLVATSPDVIADAGKYFEDCALSPNLAPHASGADDAKRLWSISEELVGQTFDFGTS